MSPRRLVLTPLIALLGVFVIAAVIATGRQQRLNAHHAASGAVARDAIHQAEVARIALLEATTAQCSPTGSCLGLWRADRLNVAATSIAAWPGGDGTFTDSRQMAVTTYAREAALIRLRTQIDVDHTRTTAERARLETAATDWLQSARQLDDARVRDDLLARADARADERLLAQHAAVLVAARDA